MDKDKRVTSTVAEWDLRGFGSDRGIEWDIEPKTGYRLYLPGFSCRNIPGFPVLVRLELVTTGYNRDYEDTIQWMRKLLFSQDSPRNSEGHILKASTPTEPWIRFDFIFPVRRHRQNFTDLAFEVFGNILARAGVRREKLDFQLRIVKEDIFLRPGGLPDLPMFADWGFLQRVKRERDQNAKSSI